MLRLLTFTLAAWGCWFVVRRRGETLSILASRILRRPFFAGLAVVAGCGILARFVGGLSLLLLKWIPVGEYAELGVSMNMASIVISLATTLTFAALTVFLARRRLRLWTNQ
jgi:magnesium-transporting ATPase (P-type)